MGSHAGAWEPGNPPKGSDRLEITALVIFRSGTSYDIPCIIRFSGLQAASEMQMGAQLGTT